MFLIKLLVIFLCFQCVFGRRASKGTASKIRKNIEENQPSSDDISELSLEDYSFAEETWHLTILEFTASAVVGICSIFALIIRNEVRRIRIRHVCPFDFSNMRDPIDRCQDLRYILTRSQNILPERTNSHKEILLNLWESEFLMDKYEVFYVLANPAEEFEFVRRSTNKSAVVQGEEFSSLDHKTEEVI
ncbi:Oidioi.mRNA.OKI2018_I69.PAR.g9538.t3.cds [Oikopleura dioica]|uniref:Oidioi.mRNA.OKI2018_I69.PAR.g9538.t3.cds n=1 Tax=Oikopleura dioica TaxID=34765 RepID=A0ABN7RQE2_OIKDI|nr:Oidioi.mRNA.OKI2018_I69.PAR.g9538.t3.cds [Oikopleura dioica]